MPLKDRAVTASQATAGTDRSAAWFDRVPLVYLSLGGAVLIWLSQPPVAFSGLAWLALIPWLHWAAKPQLRGRDYLMFFAAATI